MIQDPNIIPESLKIAGWIGGAGFTMWLVKMSFEIFNKARKDANGKANADVTKKAIEWALHMREQNELNDCTKEIVKTQTDHTQLLERLATSYERQTVLLEKLSDANKRG